MLTGKSSNFRSEHHASIASRGWQGIVVRAMAPPAAKRSLKARKVGSNASKAERVNAAKQWQSKVKQAHASYVDASTDICPLIAFIPVHDNADATRRRKKSSQPSSLPAAASRRY